MLVGVVLCNVSGPPAAMGWLCAMFRVILHLWVGKGPPVSVGWSCATSQVLLCLWGGFVLGPGSSCGYRVDACYGMGTRCAHRVAVCRVPAHPTWGRTCAASAPALEGDVQQKSQQGRRSYAPY